MEKFAVIGTGFIGTYMGKGMRAVAGTQDLRGIAFGIKGHEAGRREKEKELGYAVSVNDTARVLDRETPTIIILSPPPELAEDMARNILRPHYDKLRKRGETLPDLYSFIPSPSADRLREMLGGGVNVVKILPNIMDAVCGYDMSPVGINYISYAGDGWRADRRRILEKCMAPYGYTAVTDDIDSLVLLAGKITSHTCYEVSYTINRARREIGLDLPINAIGAAMRKAQYSIFPDMPPIGSCDDEGVPDSLKGFFKPFMQAWFDGLHSFTQRHMHKISLRDAYRVDMCSFALNVFPIQYETRAQLEQDTANAATKGGILERGVEFFYQEVEQPLKQAVKDMLLGKEPGEEFFNWARDISRRTSEEAYKRSLDLTGKK